MTCFRAEVFDISLDFLLSYLPCCGNFDRDMHDCREISMQGPEIYVGLDIWRVAHTTPQTSTPTSGIRWPHHISICFDASRGSLLIEKGYMLPTGQRYASPVVISRSPIVPKVFPIWYRRESQLWNRISIIIRPQFDHWLCLSLTHSLTDWLSDSLPFSKLYWCDPGM